MEQYIIPSVGKATIIDPSTYEIIVEGNTFTDTEVNFEVSEEEIRGGFLGGLLGKIFHSPVFGVTLTDALYSQEYIAMSVGSDIEMGGDAIEYITYTITTVNQIDVSPKVPKDFMGQGAIGWYAIAGTNDWKKITFTGSVATANGVKVGDKVCVKINTAHDAMTTVNISSSFIPSETILILTLPLFRARQDKVYNKSQQVGEVQIPVGRFQLNGGQTLTLNMTGASTTSLSGTAVVDFTSETDCSGQQSGIYAKWKQIIYGRDEADMFENIVVANSDVELASGEKTTFKVLGLAGANIAPKTIDNTKLTFTTSGSSATVANDGVITATQTGETEVEVVYTGNNDLSAVAKITVS